MRQVVTRLVIVLAASALCNSLWSADFVLSRPAPIIPTQELGAVSLQSQYDEMWKSFVAEIKQASAALESELAEHSTKAAEAAHLDLAIFWRDLSRNFNESGQLIWNAMDLERSWRSRFPGTVFPKTFLPLLQETQQKYDAAADTVTASYTDLETKLTQAGMLDQAIAIREERRRIFGDDPQGSKAVPPHKSAGNSKLQKEINLAPLVQLAGPGTLGLWKRNGTAVYCEGEKLVATSIKYKPPEEYDFGVVVKSSRRGQGGGQVVQASKMPKREFTWWLTMPLPDRNEPADRTLTPAEGFFRLSGSKDKRAFGAWQVDREAAHHMVIKVRRDGVTAVFDERTVAAMPADLFKHSECDDAFEHPLSLGTWNSQVLFTRVYLVPIKE